MEVDTVAQILTVLSVGLAIVWHQQRSVDKLRDDVNASIRDLRRDHNNAIAQIGERLARIGERLARIEGFLGIGIPPVADESPGDEPA